MAEIAPLTPLRYDLSRLVGTGGLASVVAPPYDVIDAAQRAELASRHPTNVVKLILPDGEGDAKYGHAADLLESWRTEGEDPQRATTWSEHGIQSGHLGRKTRLQRSNAN